VGSARPGSSPGFGTMNFKKGRLTYVGPFCSQWKIVKNFPPESHHFIPGLIRGSFAPRTVDDLDKEL